VMGLVNFAQQMNMTPEQVVDELENEAKTYVDENGDAAETEEYISRMRDQLAVINIVQRAQQEGNISEDMKWIRHLTYEERQTLRRMLPESDPEPDFYYMVRNLFHNPIMVLLYLITFVVLFLHMRHAFPSAFQTLGLNNYKYNNLIEVLGTIYAWIIVLMFSAVPILVYLGL